jgi:hypothetical protein
MNIFSPENKVFYIFEFLKCCIFKGNAVLENIEHVFTDEFLQDCVVGMSDVVTNCVFHCIFLHIVYIYILMYVN